MNFIDEVVVRLESGKGGSGAATFHREKHVPLGGPNGADGGRGGDIVLVADRHLRTLSDFKLKSEFKAEDGTGADAQKNGKSGKDLEIRLPVGTVVTDAESGDLFADLNIDGMRFVICQGGRGGLGNLHYTNSVHQAPQYAQHGAPSDEVTVKFELKLLADAGLIGLPNAGKSTLLSQVTKARPKIGNYPFTTLSPNLGVASIGNKSFVIADLPGLIEGASEGHGLGHQFLKHTERTKVLVHIVDAFPIDETDPWENYNLIETELALYSADLAARPRVVALNKMDLHTMGDIEAIEAKFKHSGHRIFRISGVTGEGVEPLLYHLLGVIEQADSEAPAAVITLPSRPRMDNTWDVKQTPKGFEVTGARIVKLVAMTDTTKREALYNFHKKLERIGVIDKLRDLGAEHGDTVTIDGWQFEFTDW
jgi:GTP-binding protein